MSFIRLNTHFLKFNQGRGPPNCFRPNLGLVLLSTKLHRFFYSSIFKNAGGSSFRAPANNTLQENSLSAQKVTRHELDAAIRQAGCASFHDVDFAILEINRDITVKKKS